MIIFKRVSYKNLKAVGNSPVVIDLNKANTTLITGSNGAGKSTLISALSFGLFGQDLVLNKSGIINTINLKQTEVVVEFSIDKKEYKIIRGIKPTIFKIFENNKLLNEYASSRDYQKILETQILKMDIRAFSQVITVGGRNYTPFMKLKSVDRREFIEDLLDIRVFSSMSTILKDKVKTLKEELRGNDDTLKTIKEQVTLQKSFVDKLTAEKSVSVNKIDESIRGFNADNENLTKQVDAILLLEECIGRKYSGINADDEMVALLKFERAATNTELNAALKRKKFFIEESHCPTCSQDIAHHHKSDILDNIGKNILQVEAELTRLHDNIKTVEGMVEDRLNLTNEIAKHQTEVRKLQSKIQINNHLITSALVQIEDLNKDTTSIDVEKEKLKEFAKKYVAASESRKKLLDDRQYNDLLQECLADTGIKSKIIKQYIPAINRSVNEYLEKFNLFISYHLDENFNESVKSRHRDTFTYENFSDGQKARIDLALMLSWRDIARSRNAVNTNLAIFDESDAALDAEGAALMLEIFSKFKNTNVFLISHKSDQLADKVDTILEFEIQNNFSQLKIA
jgi:DNA repair exonuclease SbcCD ATPase subunit